MALLTKKKHSFHCITAPIHILGTPPLLLRHNEHNPVRSTQDTDGQGVTYLAMALLTKFLKKEQSFQCITAPTHIIGTLPLLVSHYGPNQVSLTTGYTPNMN